MVVFVDLLLIGGLIAFATYQIVGLVRSVKKKKAEQAEKEKTQNLNKE